MKFFKNLFKKKEVIKEVKPEVVELPDNAVICNNCNKPIYAHDKRVTKAKMKLHIKCWRTLRKDAKNKMANGK